MVRLSSSSAAAFVAVAGALKEIPTFPESYTAVFTMELPYAGLVIPMKVTSDASKSAQKVSYYQGLQEEFLIEKDRYKYVYKNGERFCMKNEGPHDMINKTESVGVSILPDLSQYEKQENALVNGVECEKYTLYEKHGDTGSMDDYITFYYDALLKKPVRWHMHSRNKIFSSHTDEYIINYSDFSTVSEGFEVPSLCQDTTATTSFMHFEKLLRMGAKTTTVFDAEGKSSMFKLFAMQHGKVYQTTEEELKRETIFNENVAKIAMLNLKHEGKATFKGNRFMDMTKEEILKFRGGRKQSKKDTLASFDKIYFEKETGLNTPTNFDWRKEMPVAVAPVKDQGICGSCWAFSFISAMESANAIQTEKMTLLPEQFVLDCSWTDQSNACDGGLSDDAGRNIMKAFGGVIPSAETYGSYLTVDGYCHGIEGKQVGAKIVQWTNIPARDTDAVLQAVLKQPLSVSLNVVDEIIYYDSGIVDVEDCTKTDVDDLDHAINLVGYGTDEKTGQDYWVLRNSWSTYWGDEGYFKIMRGERDCGVSTDAGFPTVAVSETESVIIA